MLPIKGEPIISNASSMTTITTTKVHKNTKSINAAYTFKLKTPVSSRKKNDPVSLFQRTSQSWKRDKFLKSQANNK